LSCKSDINRSHTWEFSERSCYVNIPGVLLHKLISFARNSYPQETGGTLVGHYSDDHTKAHVTEVLEAKKGARRSLRSFFRPSDKEDNQLKQIYKKTRGKIHYLGEWHSHPKASPLPSYRDETTMKQLVRDLKVAADTPLLLIVGGVQLEDICCILFGPDNQVIICKDFS
jgi:integrative and conjugative element protein (TIGR02256 family)